MHFISCFVRSALVLATSALAMTIQANGGTYTTVVGSLSNNETTIGNYYNYWIKEADGTWDLTRSDRAAVTCPKTINGTGFRTPFRIEPSRSALIIIDMQNFFLDPALSPHATGGRTAVQPTVNMVKGFRKAGMKVLWTFWGLDDFDLLTLPPSFLDSFSTNDNPLKSFGSEMGIVHGVDAGRLLMRGSWNAQPYGPLNDLKNEGLAKGTDLYFNKNRLSGLWGAQTPLGLYLQENEITTLFFGGVNADQCVFGTIQSALYKGFDVVYVEDIAATTSPYYATQMVKYNVDGEGFLANSSQILAAIA